MAEPEVIEIKEEPKIKEEPRAIEVPEPPKPEVAPRPVPRRSPLWPILGGVIAAGLGYGVAQVVPDGWPIAQDDSALQAAVSEVSALKAKIAELQAQVAAADGLADRVAKLETAPAVPDLSALEDRLAKLESRPTSQGASADPAALSALRLEVEALKAQGSGVVSPQVQAQLDAQVQATAEKLAAIESRAAETAAAAVRQAALRQISAALDSGAPYVRAVVDVNDLPPVIAEHAATGLPSLTALREGFPDAARAALEASLEANMGATWSERVKNFLRAQTGARALTPQEGDDPDAVLSRAEAALAAGDVEAALAELDALPAEGKAAMTDWLAQANLRLQAEAALAPLME